MCTFLQGFEISHLFYMEKRTGNPVIIYACNNHAHPIYSNIIFPSQPLITLIQIRKYCRLVATMLFTFEVIVDQLITAQSTFEFLQDRL